MTAACKDCGSTTRALPFPGPRCATCNRAFKKSRSAAAHDARMVRDFGFEPGQYAELYAWQGGRCWICRRATGKTKRLAPDHDHNCTAGHAREKGCRQCLRGLLCGPCNFMVIGRLDAEGLQRAYWYLVDPPMRRFLARHTSG